MEDTYSFGYWIKRRRKALDLTQAALAASVGCATVTIRKLEADERRPSRTMAERLAISLKIPQDEHEIFIESGLGLAPVDMLTTHDRPIDPQRVPPSPQPSPQDPQQLKSGRQIAFAGWEPQLAVLHDRLVRAKAGDCQTLFIAGEAGRGKTALMQAFANQAQKSSPELIVLSGNCTAYAGFGDPYLPFRDLLNSAILGARGGQVSSDFSFHALETFLLDGPNLLEVLIPSRDLRRAIAAYAGAEQMRLLQLLDHQIEHGAGDSKQSQIFTEVARVLAMIARHTPLLILLDDLQWIDPASASLLFHLARRLQDSRILLVGAYRSSELLLGRSSVAGQNQEHPLLPVLQELRRHSGELVIDLEHFNPAEERRFMDALVDLLPNRLPEAFRVSLFWRTKGHPLFVLELLREMRQRGALVQDADGIYTEGADVNWDSVPARVDAVIAQRIERLDPNLRALLATGSVQGETFIVQLVAEMIAVEHRTVMSLLSSELAQRHGLVREADQLVAGHIHLARYQFSHALFQQYLYESMSEGERRLAHGEIGNWLEVRQPEDGDLFVVSIAHHFSMAGLAERAVPYLLQAGDRARTLYAHEEAAVHYQKAVQYLKDSGDHERAARTLMKLGHAYHIGFDYERAREVYDEGFQLWKKVESQQLPRVAPAEHPMRLLWDEPDSLDPTMGGYNLQAPIITQLFSGLVAQSPDLEIVPDVAHRWDVLDDGRRYVFHLRDDVFWSDGVPVTAHDFEFACKRALNPSTGAPVAASLLYAVKGARDYHQGTITDSGHIGVFAPGDHTLIIELREPASYFLQELTYYVMLPVPGHVVQRHGDDWTEPHNIVTNGPFTLLDWQRGKHMHLGRNPDYHGRFSGNLQEVRLDAVGDLQAEEKLYDEDKLDVAYSWFRTGVELDNLRKRHPDDYVRRPWFVTTYLWLRPNTTPFDDPRVRRALAMAIDKQTLADVILKGYALPATGGFLPPGLPGFSAGIGPPYDPAEARKLLADAGYSGGQGFPSLQLLTTAKLFPTVNFLHAQWLRVLGIEIEVELVDLSYYVKHITQAPLGVGGWIADYADPENFLRVDVELTVPEWHDNTYRDLLQKARKMTNQEARIKLYQQADRILTEEAVFTPLYYPQLHLLLKPWVKRFPIPAIKNPGFWKDVIIAPH